MPLLSCTPVYLKFKCFLIFLRLEQEEFWDELCLRHMGKHTHTHTFTKTHTQQQRLFSARSFFISSTIESPAVNSLYLRHRSFLVTVLVYRWSLWSLFFLMADHIFAGVCISGVCVCVYVYGRWLGWSRDSLLKVRVSWQEAFWCLFILWETWLTPHWFSSVVAAIGWNISLHRSVTRASCWVEFHIQANYPYYRMVQQQWQQKCCGFASWASLCHFFMLPCVLPDFLPHSKGKPSRLIGNSKVAIEWASASARATQLGQ